MISPLFIVRMNPRIKNVRLLKNYALKLTFDSGEQKIFDVTLYLEKRIFKELKKVELFNSIKPFLESIQWKNGQDLCPDTLYLESKKIATANTKYSFSLYPK